MTVCCWLWRSVIQYSTVCHNWQNSCCVIII